MSGTLDVGAGSVEPSKKATTSRRWAGIRLLRRGLSQDATQPCEHGLGSDDEIDGRGRRHEAVPTLGARVWGPPRTRTLPSSWRGSASGTSRAVARRHARSRRSAIASIVVRSSTPRNWAAPEAELRYMARCVDHHAQRRDRTTVAWAPTSTTAMPSVRPGGGLGKMMAPAWASPKAPAAEPAPRTAEQLVGSARRDRQGVRRVHL